MTGRSTLALVESATQLLNVAEWAYATGEHRGLRVDVLAPGDAHTLRQLAQVAEAVRELELDVRVRPVRARAARTALEVAKLGRDIAGADELIVGDPFSRFIQSLLPLSAARHVVVVDDGTATWEFVACVNEGKPLVRWQVPVRRVESRAARATRLLSQSPIRKLTVFSCLDGAHPVGAESLANNYAWTRAWNRPEINEGSVDVLGVSLADTGVIDRGAYLSAIAQLARKHSVVRYLAHRRESQESVAMIATIPGVQISRPSLPVELALRQGSVAPHIITFPSTATHTLPLVLSDLGVRIQVRRIEDSWFSPGTTAYARRFVSRIADAAPLPPALEIV